MYIYMYNIVIVGKWTRHIESPHFVISFFQFQVLHHRRIFFAKSDCFGMVKPL